MVVGSGWSGKSAAKSVEEELEIIDNPSLFDDIHETRANRLADTFTLATNQA